MGSGKNKSKNKGRPATVSNQQHVDSAPINPSPAAKLVKPVIDSPVDSLSGSRTLGEVDSWSVLTPKDCVAETSSVDKATLDQQNMKRPGTAPKRQVFERMKLQKVEFEEFAYKAAPEHMESVPSSLEFTLVGYVTGKFPGRKAIINECQTWGVNFQIHFHDSGWIIVKLHSEGDRDQVCLRGPYSVNGRWFVLKPLPRYFRFQNREDKVVPVWIRLPNLPLEMWTFDSLSNIVSRIGVPLNSDAATLKRDKLSFARVLVEVDLSKDLIYSVPVEIPDGDDFEQQIIYESVPNFCSSCKKVGHFPTHCPLLKPSQSGTKASGMQNMQHMNSELEKASAQLQPGDAAKAVHIRFVEDSEGYVNPCVSPSCAAQSHRDATRSKSEAILDSLGTKAALGDRGKHPSTSVVQVLEGGSSKSVLEKGMSDSISDVLDSRRSSRSPLRSAMPEKEKPDLEPNFLLAGPEQGTALMSQVSASSSDDRTSSSEEGSSSGSESEGELAQRVAESVIFSEENNLEEPGNFRFLNRLTGSNNYLTTEEHWINQTLDHFSPYDHRQFPQRYFEFLDHFTLPDGPIFLKICGESACNGIPNDYMSVLAKKFGAAVVSLEHRYYGKSSPFKSYKTEDLKYLSSKQALFDLAAFRQYYQDSLNTKLNRTNVDNPWFVFGVSYSGALSAWFRLKFPHLTCGSLASSAVVLAVYNFTEFDQQIGVSAGPECKAAIQEVNQLVEQKLETNGKALKTIFGAPQLKIDGDFLYFLADAAVTAFQYGNPDALCDPLVEAKKNGDDLVNAYALYIKDHYADNVQSYDQHNLKSTDNSDRLWWFQVCTEVAYFQVAPANDSMRSSKIDTRYHLDLCKNVFGEGIYPDVDGTNLYYGGTEIAGSKIVFSNGSQDPWRHASKQTSSPELPSYVATCHNCGHGTDLRGCPQSPLVPEGDAKNCSSPDAVHKVRQKIVEDIDLWLSECQSTGRSSI